MDAKVNAEELPKVNRMLEVIDRCITSRDDHYEKIKESLTEILEDIFTTIKGQSRFFREQYQGFFLLEKYYKGPKVIQPEEFDANLIIKIPIDDGLFNFSFTTDCCGEIYVNKEATQAHSIHRYFMNDWFVARQRYISMSILQATRFQRSMESLLLKAIKLHVPKLVNYTIKVHTDASVFCLYVFKKDLPEIKLNITPVIQFDCATPYSNINRDFKWYVVPQFPNNPPSQILQWREALYNHENDLLTRHSYLIRGIRQFEKLRDTQKWENISCYHIKILFLRYAREMETVSGSPNIYILTGIKLFIHMLHELRYMCETKCLQDFWKRCHDIRGDGSLKLGDIAKQLTRIIDEITVDPSSVAKWILTEDEMELNEKELNADGNFCDAYTPY